MNQVQQDNTELAVRAGNGDETAFAEIYKTHYASIYQTAYRILGSHEDAEDAVNNAFLKIWNGLPKWNPSKGSGFVSWMSVIARNYFIDAYRAKKRYLKNYGGISLEDEISAESDCVLLEVIPDPRPSIEASIIRDEMMHQLEGALLKVANPKWRLAWMLYHFEGYSYKEISAIMDARWKTCQLWSHRCNVQIKRLLEVCGEAEKR